MVVKGDIMKEWFTARQLSDKTTIPENTVRRYISKFEEFFTSKGGSRSKLYERSAINVLVRIKNLYDTGYETEQVKEFLKNEFPVTLDGDNVGEGEDKAVTPILTTNEDIIEIKEALEEQKEFNRLLLDRLDQQERYIEKSLEKRDQRLVENMRMALEVQKQETAAAIEAPQESNKKWWEFWK